MDIKTIMPIVVAVLMVFVVAWININIKHTATKEEAMRFLKSSFFLVISIAVNMLGMLFILFFLFKESPINRREIISLLVIFSGYSIQLSLRVDKHIIGMIIYSVNSIAEIIRKNTC